MADITPLSMKVSFRSCLSKRRPGAIRTALGTELGRERRLLLLQVHDDLRQQRELLQRRFLLLVQRSVLLSDRLVSAGFYSEG